MRKMLLIWTIDLIIQLVLLWVIIIFNVGIGTTVFCIVNVVFAFVMFVIFLIKND